MIIAIIIVIAVLYAAHHTKHYRRNRRSGLTVSESLRGPFGSRVRVTKRF